MRNFKRIMGCLIAALALASSVLAYDAPKAAGPAAKPADKPAQVLFQNVNIFDGKSEKLIPNANVLVEGNRIKAISPKAITAEGATVIDAGGRTLMPGLIDAHWHVMFNSVSIPTLMTADMSYLTLAGAKSAECTHSYS